jgi:hypothetical protein
MGLLDNLFLRSLAPGDLPFRRPGGIVQAVTLAPAVYGMRVEIPRVARRLLPYALDIESGIGEGNVGRKVSTSYLPAPKYPGPVVPPTYTPPIYQYPPGAVPPGAVPGVPPGAPPGSEPPGVVPAPGTPGGPPVVPPGGFPSGLEQPPVSYMPPTGTGFPWPSAPGYRRVFNLQFSADSGGSSASQEIRVTPAIGHPFRVTELDISPLAGVVVGQYIDVLVVPNAEMTDASALFGASLFEQPALLGSIPGPDAQRGIAVPLQTKRFENLGPIFQAGQQIKVVVFFTAPALAMPTLSVTLVVEEVVFSTALPPPREPPEFVPPYAAPPEVLPVPPVPFVPAPVVPGEPPGVLPLVPAPTYAIVTVVPGVTSVMNMVPQYDGGGHIVGYFQDPGQVAQWAAIQTGYTQAQTLNPTGRSGA